MRASRSGAICLAAALLAPAVHAREATDHHGRRRAATPTRPASAPDAGGRADGTAPAPSGATGRTEDGRGHRSGATAFTRWITAGCEPPAVYYSAGHNPGAIPCCPPVTGRCPGGDACPASGRCVDGTACVPGALGDRPNLALVISDDQAYCDYGLSGTCRAARSGTPLPAPHTPALDRLAAAGKIFPVAHTGAAWCFPGLHTIVTGKLPPQAGGGASPPGSLPAGASPGDPSAPTIPQLLARDAVTGGGLYCSYQVGKLGAGGGSALGFHAEFQSHSIGRTPCTRCGGADSAGVPSTCQEEPVCGEEADPPTDKNTGDVAAFFDELLVGPRDGTGNLIPGQVYLQPQPFFLWYAPRLPHVPTNPPGVVEARPHLPLPTSNDFLFGSAPLGSNHPRFPFGDPRYANAFSEPTMAGLYGNVWWVDNALKRIQDLLAARRVSAATCSGPLGSPPNVCSDAPARACTQDADCATLAAHTVVVYLTDNGAFLPRSKHHFTENGYRTALLVYDPRHTPAAGSDFRVEREVAHQKDVLPTLLAYAGRPVPRDMPGVNLGAWVDGSRTTPYRNALCGPEVKVNLGTPARYIRTRPGAIGRCTAASGPPCARDGDCPSGTLCSGTPGGCGVPKPDLCVADGDCAAGERCAFTERKWCRYGEAADQPLTPCRTDTECRAAGCTAADPIACTCEYRSLKLYVDAFSRAKVTDLFADPDEKSLDAGGDTIARSVAARLRCCLDAWWVPGGRVAAACPGGCDAAVACSN